MVCHIEYTYRKEKWFNQFSARCHSTIEASSIVWEDKKFHESCFTCWGVDTNGVQCQKVRFISSQYHYHAFLLVYLADER